MHVHAHQCTESHTHFTSQGFFSQHTCKCNAVLASAEFSVTRTWLQCKALRRHLINPIKSYLQNTFSFLGYSLYSLLKNFNILLTAAPLDALNNTDDIRLGWLYVVGRQFSLLEIRDFSEEEKQTSKQQKKFTAFFFFLKFETLFTFILTVPYSFPLLFIPTKRALSTPNRLTTPLSTVDISKRPKK